ncbi:MAG: extracellular solute-binding protein [Deltaproteobacteria bacterium]|nr:extracellular solute-binding protein [Deltaproteobacteria bacterium]
MKQKKRSLRLARNSRFVLLMGLVFFIAAPASAQDATLLEAAKKDGQIVAYGSLESDVEAAISKAFRKKTGIEVKYWRGSATKVMDRALGEYRAGRPLFDVILTNDNPMQIMWKDGIFAKYDSPAAKDFHREAIDPNLGPRYRNIIIGVVYNNRVIKPAEAPKSLEDLLKPQYRGKLAMPDPLQHTPTTQWLASLQKIMGKEKSDKYIRGLAAMKPILVESFIPATERVIIGEALVAIAFVRHAFFYGQKGAPLDYVRLEKMLGDGHYIALNNKAPHPNAGKAYIDFFLDDESMNILAKMGGEFVNRKGIYPPLPDADKIRFIEMLDLDKKGYEEKIKEYAKIFVR